MSGAVWIIWTKSILRRPIVHSKPHPVCNRHLGSWLIDWASVRLLISTIKHVGQMGNRAGKPLPVRCRHWGFTNVVAHNKWLYIRRCTEETEVSLKCRCSTHGISITLHLCCTICIGFRSVNELYTALPCWLSSWSGFFVFQWVLSVSGPSTAEVRNHRHSLRTKNKDVHS